MVHQSYSPDAITPVNTEDFLPSTSRWVTVGSLFLVLFLGGVIAASFVVKYRTTAKAPAVIRPAGEPRLVQALATGPVVSIQAENNAFIRKGEVLVQLDTASLETRAIQLLANFERGQDRLAQVDAQLISTDQQIAAEAAQSERAVIAAAADYNQTFRANRDRAVSAQSAVQEAQAQLNLADQEASSYRKLAASGAVSRLQLSEKQAALSAAEARIVSLKVALNPSQGDIQAARARVSQARAGGLSTIARLQQARQQLIQQKIEIQEQLQVTEQDIAQINLELQNSTVRSPVTGVIHELSVRNTGQVVTPGETLAKIIPEQSALLIKASLPASQINKVDVNFPTQMRVSACPFSEFGTLSGRVKSISPDLSTAASDNGARESSVRSNSTFSSYSVDIEINETHLISSKGDKCALVAGMEGEVSITSRKETIINFLRRKAGLAF